MTAVTAVTVAVCMLSGLIYGAAAAEALTRHHPVAAVLFFALGVLVSWCGVVQL